MKVGIIPINIGVQSADQIVQTAQLVESLGYESVWTFEHVIVPVNYDSKYPYNKSGNMGAAPETNFVDPLIALSAVAASTKTLRLATGVNILSQVNPIYMAKQAASHPTTTPCTWSKAKLARAIATVCLTVSRWPRLA